MTFLSELTDRVPPELQALLDRVLPGPVGTTTATIVSEDLDLERPIDLFGVATELALNAGGALRLWGEGDVVPLLETPLELPVASPGFGEGVAVPTGQAILEVSLQGAVGLEGAAEGFPASGLKVSGSAKAGSEVLWRHLRAAPTGADLGKEVADLLATSLLPTFALHLDPDRVAELRHPEVFLLDTQLYVNLGVDVAYGSDFTFEEVLRWSDGLFQDLEGAVRLHVAATLSASLGWSLYERMQASRPWPSSIPRIFKASWTARRRFRAESSSCSRRFSARRSRTSSSSAGSARRARRSSGCACWPGRRWR